MSYTPASLRFWSSMGSNEEAEKRDEQEEMSAIFRVKNLEQDIQELQRASDTVHAGGTSGRPCFVLGA